MTAQILPFANRVPRGVRRAARDSFSNPDDYRFPKKNNDLYAVEVFCASGDPSCEDVLKQARPKFRSVAFSHDVVSVLRMASLCDGTDCVLFVDIDDMQDTSIAVEALISLRRGNPKLPVVIMSETFNRDEANLERSAISDVSLRLPVSQERMLKAVSDARHLTGIRLGRG